MHSNTYVNHWEITSKMVSIEDTRMIGGGSVLKQKIWNAARSVLFSSFVLWFLGLCYVVLHWLQWPKIHGNEIPNHTNEQGAVCLFVCFCCQPSSMILSFSLTVCR